ncbi:MAG: hypothetical protein RLW62_23935 [Gammaproteobacteria bacterium]
MPRGGQHAWIRTGGERRPGLRGGRVQGRSLRRVVALANAHDVEQEDWLEGELARRGEVEIWNASQERPVAAAEA